MIEAILMPTARHFTRGTLLMQALHVVLGGIFLSLIAQIAFPLPWTDVPLTFQSLAVLLLAMTLGKKKAALSVLTYLAQATYGLPVLAGGLVNPAWMVGPRAGYLVGFLAAAYLVGALLEKQKVQGFIWSLTSLALGELTILMLGSLWLALFVGWQNAFMMGFFPFLLNAGIKIMLASSLIHPFERFQQKLMNNL